jgi:hypothetical protein
MMCARENPIYEQVSNFSVALYILGHLRCADVMELDDIEITEAAGILKEHFIRINEEEWPSRYHIAASDERYLLVFGDPAFPEHFAALVDSESDRPYFSKLKFFGSGFDSLEELKQEFLGKDGVGRNDIAFFRSKTKAASIAAGSNKIYTLKSDGTYSVLELNRPTTPRR